MQSENKFLIPLAVIVAGALIGGAVFFKDRAPSVPSNGDTPSGAIDVAPISTDDHVLGNPNADVVLITFSDIDCPFCKTFDATMRQIMDVYGKDGRVAWVYRQFPLDSLHPDARTKAESTECVASLAGNEAFWTYIGLLFTTENETVAGLGDIAVQAGVDKVAFEKCLSDGTFKQAVADDVAAAMKAGGRGTPYTVIVGKDGTTAPLSGALPYAQVEETLKTFLTDAQ